MTLSIVAERTAANLWFPVRKLFTKILLCDIVNNNSEKRGEMKYAEFIKIIPINSKENSFAHCYWDGYYGIRWNCNSLFYFQFNRSGNF